MAPSKVSSPHIEEKITPVPLLDASKAVSGSKKRALDDSPTKPSSSSVNGPKRAKVNLVIPPPVTEANIKKAADLTWDGEEGDDDDENENEGDDEIPEDVQERLDSASSMVENLSKSYLKDVIKGLDGFYGSRGGTNRNIVTSITDHLEQTARSGGDLIDEERVIRRVHRACYPSFDEVGEEDEDY